MIDSPMKTEGKTLAVDGKFTRQSSLTLFAYR
jgi:hypothetical protein